MRSPFPSVLNSSGANIGIIRIEMKFPGAVCIVDTATKFNSSVSSNFKIKNDQTAGRL